MREYQYGVKHEISALDNFAEKNVLEGEPAIMAIDFFEEKTPKIKEFLRNHRNTKIKMIMVRLMDKKRQERLIKKTIFYSR